MTKIFNLKNTIIFVFFSVLWKIFISSLPLHSDEAYYWLWSKKLSFSYYDHSPMVAYFIKLTTLFSDSEFCVRFSSIIVTVIISVLLWKLVMKLFNNETLASASIVILHCMPILFTASVIITPDTPVFLFLSLATYSVFSLGLMFISYYCCGGSISSKLINAAFFIVKRSAYLVHTVPIQVSHDIDAISQRGAFPQRSLLDSQQHAPVIQVMPQALNLDVKLLRVDADNKVFQR